MTCDTRFPVRVQHACMGQVHIDSLLCLSLLRVMFPKYLIPDVQSVCANDKTSLRKSAPWTARHATGTGKTTSSGAVEGGNRCAFAQGFNWRCGRVPALSSDEQRGVDCASSTLGRKNLIDRSFRKCAWAATEGLHCTRTPRLHFMLSVSDIRVPEPQSESSMHFTGLLVDVTVRPDTV